jgi:pimeloyl-ACP methyl ester carboxylesterase
MRARVAVVVALLVLSGCTTTVAAAQPPATDAGRAVDIGGGRHLWMECTGAGGPTIVLESGYHDSADLWTETDATAPAAGPAVMPALAAGHRVCRYDRPGTLRYGETVSITDRSSPVPMPRTAQNVVDDLHALLAASGEPGPYVLVAHSMGGLFGRLYAQQHPDQVQALLFVDAFPIEIPALAGAEWPTYRKVLNSPAAQFAADPAFETIDVDASVTQVEAAPAFPAIPIAVLTKTQPFPFPPDAPAGLSALLDRIWPEGALKLAALRPQTPQTVVNGSDHYIHVHQPDVVVATTELLLHRV